MLNLFPLYQTKLYYKNGCYIVICVVYSGLNIGYIKGKFTYMPRKKTLQDYFDLAQKRDFVWVGAEFPKNTHTNTTWRCSLGHEWVTTYHAILTGNGCPYCSDKYKKTETDYLILADARGFKWVGPMPERTHHKTVWECPNGHRWEAAYSIVKQGTGCPHCYGNVRKIEQDYVDLAESIGYKFLGPMPPNVTVKTNWQCPEGHVWNTTYSEIQSGYRCGHCAGTAKKTKEDYLNLAQEIDYEWLDCDLDPVPSTHTPTKWKCDQGHVYSVRYDALRKGQRCPYCFGNAQKTPEDYYQIAAERGYEWLGPVVTSVTAKTKWKCPEGHIWEAGYNSLQTGYGCQTCARKEVGLKIRIKPEDYRKLEDETGFTLLDPIPEYAHDKATWRCTKGHIIKTSYHQLYSGRGCFYCGIESRAEKARLKEDSYYALAEKRGFTWVGPIPATTNHKSLWICDKGHQWQARYSDLLHGVGCPQCAYSLWVNGQRASKLQLQLAENLNIPEEHINYKFGPYWLDIALPNWKICVEYDSWYWHTDEKHDEKRDRYLFKRGWKVLRVKSGSFLPEQSDIERALYQLLRGEQQTEIVLDDWKENYRGN